MSRGVPRPQSRSANPKIRRDGPRDDEQEQRDADRKPIRKFVTRIALLAPAGQRSEGGPRDDVEEPGEAELSRNAMRQDDRLERVPEDEPISNSPNTMASALMGRANVIRREGKADLLLRRPGRAQVHPRGDRAIRVTHEVATARATSSGEEHPGVLARPCESQNSVATEPGRITALRGPRHGAGRASPRRRGRAGRTSRRCKRRRRRIALIRASEAMLTMKPPPPFFISGAAK